MVTRVSPAATERVSSTGFSVTPARRLPPAPAMKRTVQSEGSQFSPIRSTTARTASGMAAGTGRSRSSSTHQSACSPVVEVRSRRRPGQATAASIFSMIESGSSMSVPPQPTPGFATWKYRPGVDRRPRTRMPAGRMPRTRPAWCSVRTPVMWSSTTITSSAWPSHCLAKMPAVAEPHPTRMRLSGVPSTTGALPACTTTSCPPSMRSETGSPAQSRSIVSQAALPSFLEPPVRWRTPPTESICEPYSAVVTWPTSSPPPRAPRRARGRGAGRCRSSPSRRNRRRSPPSPP